MFKIYRQWRAWLAGKLAARPMEDPTVRFSGRDWADLPVHHPRCD